MILEPNLKEFQHCAEKIKSKGTASSAPEQDFLSTVDVYIDRWRKLPVKYNWQPHQLRYLAGRMQDHEGERRLPIDDISIFHFSGDVCPRDYFHGGFSTLWTGDGENDWEHFREQMVEFYSKKIATPEDEEKIRCSIQKWKEAHDEAWDCAIRGAVGEYDGCPLCHSESGNMEHAFWACPKTKEALKKWKQNRFYVKKITDMETLIHFPKLFPASLTFVSAVSSARHPDGHPGNDAGDIMPSARQTLSKRTTPKQTRSKRTSAKDNRGDEDIKGSSDNRGARRNKGGRGIRNRGGQGNCKKRSRSTHEIEEVMHQQEEDMDEGISSV